MKLPDAQGPLWFNGEWTTPERVRVDPADPGLHAGLGVFETLGVDDGECLELDEHLTRLRHGAGRLGIDLPDVAAIREAVIREAGRHLAGRAWVKIVATRGGRRMVFGGELGTEPDRPCRAVLLAWRRNPRDPLANVKTLNYAPSVLGLEEAARRGADEGLWLNTRGHLAEGCSSNLFVIRRRRVYTPGEREGILPGITRAAVLAAARRLGLSVHEGKLRLPRLLEGDEALLTSSVSGIRPLVAVDGRPIGNGRPGAVGRTIVEEVRRARRRASEESHSWNMERGS